MSVSRACKPCRDSKIKCDLQRPICGACARRGLACEGYASESQYLFRDQNDTARLNSQRARAQRAQSSTHQVIVPAQSADGTALVHRKAMPWLNEQTVAYIASQPTFTVSDKARHIFYNEWILHACQHSDSPGYLDVLPVMETRAANTTALHLAVEAASLANIQNFTISGGNLREMAQTKYGEALAAVRTAVGEYTADIEENILLAILMIDLFEVAFMNRGDSLGPHSMAIEQILTMRKERNVTSTESFSLYRMAHHRLQTRQLMLGLEPIPVQLECINLLNASEPAISLGQIFLRAQDTFRMTRELLAGGSLDAVDGKEQASSVIEQIKAFLEETQLWVQRTPKSWQPQILQVDEYEDIRRVMRAASLSDITQVILYHDPWIAYQMNFYHAGQLSLRSTILDILAGCLEATSDDLEAISLRQERELQQKAVAGIADAMIQSVPMLIGATVLPNSSNGVYHAKKTGWCFAQGACWALQHSEHVSWQHKVLAENAILWLRQIQR